MHQRRLLPAIMLCLSFCVQAAQGQDTLPRFTLVNRAGRIIISWTNPYPEVVQISVQRSFDSTRGFMTVMSLPDPKAQVNGYLDLRAPNPNMFYRIYIQRGGGSYFVTLSKRPVPDTARNQRLRFGDKGRLIDFGAPEDGSPMDTVAKKPGAPVKYVWKPSVHLFTNPQGQVELVLPEPERRSYRIQFYNARGYPTFEVKRIRQSPLILDRSNFPRPGWYEFELYENDALKERNKFLIPRNR